MLLRTLLPTFLIASAACAQVAIEKKDDRYTVKLDGELFTEYRVKGFDKPVLYPVIGPGGVGMTRNWPLADAAEGEEKDHPHHKSLWFTHGAVNGVDFWKEDATAGKIVADGEAAVSGDTITLSHRWLDPAGKEVCKEQRRMKFSKIEGGKVIDIQVKLIAGELPVTFGDTKEGTMGIRTHPKLEINNGAVAVNSEGVKGKNIWGKRAKWVDYSAEIGGKKVGVAIFDHPGNPRHPTWWHAREYGLVAANPFGIHDFEKKPAGAGDMKVEPGKSVEFNYRFIFHEGDAQSAKVAELYEKYAGEKRDPGTKGSGTEK